MVNCEWITTNPECVNHPKSPGTYWLIGNYFKLVNCEWITANPDFVNHLKSAGTYWLIGNCLNWLTVNG